MRLFCQDVVGRRLFHLLDAVLLTCSPALFAQTTWIVDDNGGPGVDFTDLPPAIAASGPFDTILVRAGNYSSTTIPHGCRIVGAGAGVNGAWVLSNLDVRNLPAAHVLVVSGLRVTSLVQVRNCDGVVALEDIFCNELSIDASFDVRVARFTAWAPRTGMSNRVVGSRVELVDCELRGNLGSEELCAAAGSGGLGLDILASFVQLAGTVVYGGDGGYCNEQLLGCCFNVMPAIGGIGLRAADSQLVLSGASPGDGVRGGDGGQVWRIFQVAECPCGPEGPGLIASASAIGQASLRLSDVLLTGNPPSQIGLGVSVVQASGDPVLRLGGPVVAGQPVFVHVDASAGERVVLEFGRSAVRQPDPLSPVEQLTSAERRAAIGTVPGTGTLTFSLQPPASWPPGTLFFMQARVENPASGVYRRSNSAPFLVR